MRKISFILLILFICLGMTSCRGGVVKEINTAEKTKHLYLVAGFDDAAENTDALLTVGYDKEKNLVSVAQIPRDTYFNFGKSQNKINQLYATYRAEGLDKWNAMSALSRELSEALGIELDGFVGITTAAFRNIVDTLGGIDIELSMPLDITDDSGETKHLSAGVNRIFGKDAEFFVRHRQGYTMGDLGRMDAQKIFLNALFGKVSQGLTLPDIIGLVRATNGELTTNVDISELTKLFLANISAMPTSKSAYATLPGEAILSESGLSYFVVNRRAAMKMTEEFMYREGEFDKNLVFLNKEDTGFANIYEDDGISYKTYYSEDIKNIKISKTNLTASVFLLEEIYDDRIQYSEGFSRR